MKEKNSLVLILLIAGVVSTLYFLALVGTSMTGLVVATYESQQTLTVNEFYQQNETISFQRENLSSLKITGNISGNGSIAIFLQTQNDVLEIYSAVLDNESLTLTEECLQTCNLESINSSELLIQIDDDIIFYLEEIKYKTTYQIIQEQQEKIKDIQNFTLLINETLTIDLSNYFEGQEVFYDAMSSQGYSYTITQNILEITPLKLGVWSSKIYAVVDEVVFETEDFFIEILINQTTQEDVTEEVVGLPVDEDAVEDDVFELDQEVEEEIVEEVVGLPVDEDVVVDDVFDLDQEVEEEIVEEVVGLPVDEDVVVDDVFDLDQEVEEEIVEEQVVVQPDQEEIVEEPVQQMQIQQINPDSFSTRTAMIPNDELEGVLSQSQIVTIVENYYSQNVPQRNDIIAFNHIREGTVFKIIKGIPGDSFRVENNRIYINNQVLLNNQGQEYVISSRAQTLLRLYERDYNREIPENAYLILGNLPNRDTGSARYGLVHINNFEGIITN
ncbi:MAG: signal peptidase I [Candidatus Woesearchaeota archaeon]